MKKVALKLIIASVALTMASSVLVGCKKDDAAPTTAANKANQVFKLSKPAKADSTKVFTTLINTQPLPAFNGNPYDAAGLDWSVQPILFDYLADYSPFPERTFKPSLLEKFEFKNKVLTMTLKKDLKWSDGSPLNADDVLANFYLGVGRSTMWTYAKSVEKVDNLSIKIEYVTESPLVLNVTFNSPIMAPNKVYGKWADQYKDIAINGREINPSNGYYKFKADALTKKADIDKELLNFKPKAEEAIVCGPYIVETVTTSEIMFKVNPNYRVKPLITKVRGLRPGTAQAFASSILNRDYTLENGGLAPDMAKQVESKYKNELRQLYAPELSQIGYSFNITKYPLNIPEVRKAISLATDRDTLITIAEPGSLKSDWRNSGLLPTLTDSFTNKGFMDKLPNYAFNQKKAEEVLTKIGWKKNAQGQWLDDKGVAPKIEIATVNSWPSFMMTAEAMSTMLKEFGFNIDFKPMENASVWKYLASGDQMIGANFMGGATAYNHPWETFNNIYIASAAKLGLPVLKEGEELKLKAPTSGKEYNVSQMLIKLFNSTDEKEIKQITEDFITLTNDLCIFMPVIEKASTLRVYDQSLSLAEGTANELQKSYYYYGDLNKFVGKMLREGQIFFTE